MAVQYRTAKREPSRSAAGVRAEIVRGLVENYGMAIADVARQVGLSTSGASKILTGGLST
jgi:antitoxin component HigA of HigAB toxin-antitoxin module